MMKQLNALISFLVLLLSIIFLNILAVKAKIKNLSGEEKQNITFSIKLVVLRFIKP